MSKGTYILLGGALVAAVCWATGVFDGKKESGDDNQKTEQVATENSAESENQENVSNNIDSLEQSSDSEKKSEDNNQKDGKLENVKFESVQDVEYVNMPKIRLVSAKKEDKKSVVVFKDGKTVTEGDINKEMQTIPQKLAESMSVKDARMLFSLKKILDQAVIPVARSSEAAKSEDIKSDIEKKKRSVLGMMCLHDKATEKMTPSALEKHYDKIWEENFKNTSEFSLIVVSSNQKSAIDSIKKVAKDKDSLKKQTEGKQGINVTEVSNKPEAVFPPEMVKSIKDAGVGKFVGPFELRGTYVLIFVNGISPAKKQEFSTIKEEYKRIAEKDFSNDVMKELYKTVNVKFFDVNGKEVSAESILDRSGAQEFEKSVDISKVKEDHVLANVGKDKTTVKDILKFFKIKSLTDESFIMMAQQFNMSLQDLVVYATKLVVDDKLLSVEVDKDKYADKQENKDKVKEIEDIEYLKSYLGESVKVTPEQIKKVYNEFIKSIPPEDKNDQELATKLSFYSSKEEAQDKLKSITKGSLKANEEFKSNPSVLDMGYIGKKSVEEEVWKSIKRVASGTCSKEVIQVDGDKYGFSGKNYAIVYVGNRRPVTLPSLSNPNDKKYFENMARQIEIVEVVSKIISEKVTEVDGQPVEKFLNDPMVKKMLGVLVSAVR